MDIPSVERFLLPEALVCKKTFQFSLASLVMPKLTFVLVHGAWHSPAHLVQLSAEIKQRGYEVLSGQLPSVGPPDPGTATLEAHAEFVKEHLLLPLIGHCKDIIVVAHSYGGCVASTAAKGLSKIACSSHGKQGGFWGWCILLLGCSRKGNPHLTVRGMCSNPRYR